MTRWELLTGSFLILPKFKGIPTDVAKAKGLPSWKPLPLLSRPCPSLWALKTQLPHCVPASVVFGRSGLCSGDKGSLLGEGEVKASFETTKYSWKERNLWEVLVKPNAIRVTQGPRATPGGGGRLSVAAYRQHL